MAWIRALFRRRPPKRMASMLGTKILVLGMDAATAKGGRYGL